MAIRTYLYLGGDSYPLDQHIEEALRNRLAEPGTLFLGEREIVGPIIHQGFARRAHLEDAIASLGRSGIVLIGRSSGARIVTMLAAERPGDSAVGAVVAIGYPFRHPERADEPERYAHLPTLVTPTLIVQGERDPYGGLDCAARFRRPPIVNVVMVDGDHELRLLEQQWDQVTALIRGDAAGEEGPAFSRLIS
ncbi:MAG TPA: alpha/beta family hydrolase [Bosea sp. (in: a-proteobacteria)]|jgi:hypothetical protein|nr:alpha/beta family hydrolase [Bosea sp. (in: a-proteobacteria)]